MSRANRTNPTVGDISSWTLDPVWCKMAFFKRVWHKVEVLPHLCSIQIQLEADRAFKCCLRSVAGPVIQATGRTDFEDGSRTGTTLEVSNGLHSISTSPKVNMAGPN